MPRPNGQISPPVSTYLRRGDVLVVLDRLGRLAGELITLIDELNERGIGFRALNSPMDTTTPAGRAFLQIQAAFAEMERNVIRQRVREGVRAARARGRKGGRPRIMTAEKLRYAQSLMADRDRSIPEICRELGDLPTSTPTTPCGPTARSSTPASGCSPHEPGTAGRHAREPFPERPTRFVEGDAPPMNHRGSPGAESVGEPAP